MTRISPYKKGGLRFSRDDERRMPSEVRTYFLNEAELEELNRKYPTRPQKIDPGVRILATMYRDRAEKLAREKEEKQEKGEEAKTLSDKKEPKITREQLLEECRAHGTGLEAATVIGEKYGLSKYTVYTYIGKWGIKEELGVVKSSSKTRRGQNRKEAVKAEEKSENIFQIRYTRTARRDDIANMVQGIANVIRSLEDAEYEFHLEVSQVEGRKGA